ncbi:MAG: MurR/RpiR family transcriptional regulator [Actinomycetota bacterium]
MSELMSNDASRDDVITSLRERYDELTDSQKRIAETIVEDPQFVAFATVDKFAARLNVSASTIVRFAYRPGLSGYPELQEQVRELVLGTLNAGADGTEVADHLGDGVVAESLRHDLVLLERTIERLQPAEIEKAVQWIVDAERIRIVGGVTAFSAAYYTSVTLERVRDRVALLDGGPVPAGPLIEMEAGDVLLAFSFAPYARSTQYVINAVKERGARVIVVTDSPISPFRDKADVLLLASVSGIGTQNSLVAAFAVANAIVNAVAAKSPGALERYGETIKLLDGADTYLLESSHGNDG